MKINDIITKSNLDILFEESVLSSWISDITLRLNSNDVVMALGNGRRYLIKNLGQRLFQQWLNSPSKGKFWHEFIRDNYFVKRIN